MIFSLVSCRDEKGYGHAELIIQLDEDFKKTKNDSYDKTYTNGTEVIALRRISFVAGAASGIPETLMPKAFGELWLEKCGREAIFLNTSPAGVAYCTYYEGVGDDEVFYLEAFYRTPYAYFVILCAAPGSQSVESRVKFISIIDSADIKKTKDG